MNKLVTKVDRLRTDIAMYDAQINAQSEEMKAANRNLTEAATELEVTTKCICTKNPFVFTLYF